MFQHTHEISKVTHILGQNLIPDMPIQKQDITARKVGMPVLKTGMPVPKTDLLAPVTAVVTLKDRVLE